MWKTLKYSVHKVLAVVNVSSTVLKNSSHVNNSVPQMLIHFKQVVQLSMETNIMGNQFTM